MCLSPIMLWRDSIRKIMQGGEVTSGNFFFSPSFLVYRANTGSVTGKKFFALFLLCQSQPGL